MEIYEISSLMSNEDEESSEPAPSQRKVKAKFTEEEDKKIMDIVREQGARAWRRIAEQIPGRTARQCRERWMNYLSPDVKHSPWTLQEDELIMQKVGEMGQLWSKIAKHFPGRTDVTIKNRYMKLMRHEKKRLRKANKESPENLLREVLQLRHTTVLKNHAPVVIKQIYDPSSSENDSYSSSVEEWFLEDEIDLSTLSNDWGVYQDDDVIYEQYQ